MFLHNNFNGESNENNHDNNNEQWTVQWLDGMVLGERATAFFAK